MLPLILFVVVRRVVSLDPRNAERAAFALTVAGVALSLIGIGEKLLGFELSTLSGASVRFDQAIGEVRIAGPYEAPEPYGLAVVVCLAATMYWLLARRREGRPVPFGPAIVGLQLVALFFAFFRVGWISAVVVIVVALGLRPRRFGRFFSTVLIAGLVFGFAFSQLEHIEAVSTRVSNTENISTRFAIYQQGWAIFKAHPLFGVGVTRYHAVAQDLPPTYVAGAISQPYPHSSFFEVMGEDGVLGLVALVFVFVAAQGVARALNRGSPGPTDSILAATLVGVGISYLIYSLTLTMLPYAAPNELIAMLLGIGAGRLDGRVQAPR
jgi:O-antigen ligase